MNVLSLFDGMSCAQIALSRAGIPVDKYFASEVDKYAIKVTQANYPDTVQLGDVTKVRGLDLPTIDLIVAGSPCFVAGEKVLTYKGYKSIEDVLAGDFVLTHTGKWRKVLKAGGEINKSTLKIKSQGMLETTTTEDHPYYVKTMTRVWDNTKRTSVRAFSEPYWKKAGELIKGDFLAVPIMKEERDELGINEDEAFIIGRYIADGHTTKTFKGPNRGNNRNWQVILSVGNDKIPKTPIKHSLIKHTNSCTRMVFSSKKLVELVEENCGSGAVNKKLSNKILRLPNSLLKKVIEGLISGDGCVRGEEIRLTTVSRELAQSLCIAIAKVYNVCASIEYTERPKTTVIEGRLVNQRDTYTVSYRECIKKQSKFHVTDDHIWVRFKASEVGGKAEVYNIEVEGDNSYTINNVVVHNCQGFSFAGKQLNFNDTRSALFFEVVRLIKECKPKYFLIENVKMKKEYQDVISEALGVQPILINSSLVSAQNRQRLYWCNWSVTQPEDKELVLKDILESSIAEGADITERMRAKREGTLSKSKALRNIRIPQEKSKCLTARGQNISNSGATNVAVDNGELRIIGDSHPERKRKQLVFAETSFRKLTPLECERLQTVPQYTKTVEIILCSDRAKSFVDAVEKNPKLLKLVLSAESRELGECVKLANQSMSVSPASIKYTAQQSADIQTQTQIKKRTNHNQDKQSIPASNVGNITMSKQVESEASSAIQNVFIDIIEGKITHHGREELPQIERSYTEQTSGKIVLNMCGSEMVQNAKDVLSVLEMMRINALSTSITSFCLSSKNLEQIIAISYWFAQNAIDGFTQGTIKTKILYLNLIDGYTNHVSSNQRYKMLGNGFTVDVIAHILEQIKKDYVRLKV